MSIGNNHPAGNVIVWTEPDTQTAAEKAERERIEAKQQADNLRRHTITAGVQAMYTPDSERGERLQATRDALDAATKAGDTEAVRTLKAALLLT